VKLPKVVGCLHPTHADSLDLRFSTLEPLNSGTMQIRVCKIGPVIFEYECIRVYVSIISECHLVMKAVLRYFVLRLLPTRFRAHCTQLVTKAYKANTIDSQ